eukprot:snap_masked-scaffold_7-processed-gene-6.26-mRNA-1 protein AED:1.00 eAED:1.00 QI:0/-1/0/0/-1/1/1/0/278
MNSLNIDNFFPGVYGMNPQKSKLFFSFLLPLIKPEIYKKNDIKPPKGAILYGESGTGKSYILTAFISSLKKYTNVLQTSSSELISPVVGESEKNIVELFQKARNLSKQATEGSLSGVVIFIEQIQFLTPKRTTGSDESQHNTYDRVLSTFLVELDGILSKTKFRDNNLKILVTANRLDQLDGAILRRGRLDIKIKCTLPTVEERYLLWKELLGKRTIQLNDFQSFEELVHFCVERSKSWKAPEIKNFIEGRILEYIRTLDLETVTPDDYKVPDSSFLL